MPLSKGKKSMSKNMRELMTGKPGAIRAKAIKTIAKKQGISEKQARAKQAAAISYSKARKGK